MGNKEMFEIKGDVVDPRGTDRRGTEVGVDLTKGAIGHPRVRFRDRICTLDLYAADDELMVHMYCPRCKNANRISSKAKRIDWIGERISVEAFRCTWPGCGLRLEIRDNVATEA